MSVVKKSITVTEQQEAWIKAQVQSGKFGNDSEVYRATVRQAQEIEKRRDVFYAAVQQGIDSGVSDRQIPDIINDAKKALRAKNSLPS